MQSLLVLSAWECAQVCSECLGWIPDPWMHTGWSDSPHSAPRPSPDTFFPVSAPLFWVPKDGIEREAGPGSSWKDFLLVPRLFFQLNNLQAQKLLVDLHAIKYPWVWVIEKCEEWSINLLKNPPQDLLWRLLLKSRILKLCWGYWLIHQRLTTGISYNSPTDKK